MKNIHNFEFIKNVERSTWFGITTFSVFLCKKCLKIKMIKDKK